MRTARLLTISRSISGGERCLPNPPVGRPRGSVQLLLDVDAPLNADPPWSCLCPKVRLRAVITMSCPTLQTQYLLDNKNVFQ